MIHYLAQGGIKLPGPEGSQVNISYPKGFLFGGGANTVGAIISQALPLVIGLAGLGLLVMLISAGYTFMTSAGDAKKMEEGRQRLTNAILGFVIIFGAYWLVQIVGVMFGTTVTSGFK